MAAIANRIKGVIDKIGKGASFLILAIMAIVSFEVVSRYGFDHPTSWAWLVNKQLFGVFVMIAGAYALIHKAHIRIEIFYDHFTPWMKRLIQWFTLIISCAFLAALVWKGAVMGWQSFSTREVANGVFRLPLYPLKLFIPVGALLFLLGCLVVYSRKE